MANAGYDIPIRPLSLAAIGAAIGAVIGYTGDGLYASVSFAILGACFGAPIGQSGDRKS
jgi:hypothetical protein